MIRVQAEPFDPGVLLENFRASAGDGAIASFVGTVRGDDGVVTLNLDHYPGFTEKQLERLRARIAAEYRLSACTLLHRHGAMSVGEPIVFAATAAPHRRAALDALDALVEALKTEAPFWKRETRGGTDTWLEPPMKETA